MTPVNASFDGLLKRSVIWLMLLLTFAFFAAALCAPMESKSFDNEPIMDFSSGWMLLDETGQPTQQPLDLPTRIQTSNTVRITKVVPSDLPQPAVLGFRTAHQQVKLFYGGELIYSFGYDSTPLFGKSPGSVWNLIRLPQISPDKQLVLELTSPYTAYQGKIEDFFVGSKAASLFYLLRQNIFSLVLTMVICGIGLMTLLAYALVIRKDNAVGKETLYLGLFAVFVSLWMFGEGRLIQFFSIPSAFNTYMTLLAMLATPIPLVKYIACGRSPSNRKLLQSVAKLLMALYLLSFSLQITGLLDFIEQLPLLHGCLILTCIVVLYAIISDTVRRPGVSNYRLTLSMGVLALFFALETTRLYTSNHTVGSMMRIGVLVFIGMQAQTAFKNASQMMRMSRLASVDALTGCLNRTAYNQLLSELDGQDKVGVVIADINDLKLINDTYGHAVGDEAIVRCSSCFCQAFAPLGQCFRIGGDEFTMLGQSLSEETLHKAIVQFEALALAKSAQLSYPFSISCGSAAYDAQQEHTLSDTVRRADKLMYRNKRQFKLQSAPPSDATSSQ